MDIVVGKKEELSKKIAEEIAEFVNKKKNAVLGLPTGTTPLDIYANLIKMNKSGQVSFKDVATFNLDEYIGLEPDDKQSYRYFMDSNLFNHIDIDKAKTHVLKGTGDYVSYMQNYDKLIDEFGGIDIQLLGIGSDGHIGFNEPGTSFNTLTHIAELTDSTIKDNSRLFDDISQVPTTAVTMGLKSIMKARRVILLATGKNKAKAIYELINGKMTEEMPCSILQQHPNCTIYVDNDAYSMVRN